MPARPRFRFLSFSIERAHSARLAWNSRGSAKCRSGPTLPVKEKPPPRRGLKALEIIGSSGAGREGGWAPLAPSMARPGLGSPAGISGSAVALLTVDAVANRLNVIGCTTHRVAGRKDQPAGKGKSNKSLFHVAYSLHCPKQPDALKACQGTRLGPAFGSRFGLVPPAFVFASLLRSCAIPRRWPLPIAPSVAIA